MPSWRIAMRYGKNGLRNVGIGLANCLLILTSCCLGMLPAYAQTDDEVFVDGFETFDPQVIFAGQEAVFDLTILAGELDPATLAYGASPLPLPQNALLDGADFSFRPTIEQVGTFEFVFTARQDGETIGSNRARVLVLSPPADGITALSGRLMDANAMVDGQAVPIAGATVSTLDGSASTISADDGWFELAPIPDGEIVLDIDSSTADSAPDGSLYASFREPVVITPRIANLLPRSIYLPRLDPDSATEVDPSATTVVENPALGVSLEIPPGTAKNADGSDFSGIMTISEVPVEFSPRELPRELRPSMLLTIQPTGVRFSQPVPLVFPNDADMPPGSESNIWSLDPRSGRFIVVGRGRVSDDGVLTETVEGGVRTASWHGYLPPAAIQAPAAQIGENPEETAQSPAEQSCPTGSSVGMQSGCLGVRHTIPGYQTFGVERSISLSYESQTAYPNPIINVETSLGDNTATPLAYGIELLDVAGIAQDFRAFSDANRSALRQAVRFDASALPTGRYPYTLMLDSEYPASAVGNRVTGNVLVNNLADSAVGAGWQLDAVSRIVRTEGDPLLREADGALKRFSQSRDDALASLQVTEEQARRFSKGDFNGDARPDIVLGAGVQPTRVRLATGSGGFSAPLLLPSQITNPGALATADFNSDGLDDLVIAAGSSPSIEVLIATGAGEFAPPVALMGRDGTLEGGLVIDDFNSDGLLDIATSSRISDDVAVFIATAPDAFEPAVFLSAGGNPENIAAADLNLDGNVDLVVDNSNTEDVSVFLGNGDGSFAPEIRQLSFRPTRGCLALEDVNRDGIPDLIGIERTSFQPTLLLVHFGEGDGQFGSRTEFPLEEASRICRIADLNADGLVDVVIGDTREQVSVLLGNQAGSFDDRTSFSAGNSLDSIVVDDFDGDNRADVLALSDLSVNLLAGNGDGTLAAGRSSEFGDGGNAAFSNQLADFDGDGVNDLVVAARLDGILLLSGDGRGGFSLLNRIPVQRMSGIDAGDLNNDGLTDIVIVREFPLNTVFVYLANSDGTFADPIVSDTGNGPVAMRLIDVNQDGNIDVLVANERSLDISLLLGNGDGSLMPRQNFPLSGGGPEDVTAKDLDGDGNPDLVAITSVDDSIAVAWSTGPGQFEDPVTIPTGNVPRTMAIEDLNSDGFLDIVTANQVSEDIFIHFGRAGRQFEDPIVFSAERNPQDIAIADLDASGTLDIAVADASARVITVLSNNGDGSWDDSTVATGTLLRGLIGEDIDGDERADLLAMTRQTVSFLRNRTREGVWAGPPGDFSTLAQREDGGFIRRFPDGTVDRFDADGLQTERTLPSGQVTQYEYNGNSALWTIIDPAGKRTDLRYTGSRLSEIVDPAGRSTRLEHDSAGNLLRIINPDGTSRQFVYDSNHLLRAQIDTRGNRTDYAYDETGRLTGSTLPDGANRQVAPSQTTALAADPASTSPDNPAPAVPASDVAGAFIDAKDRMVTFKLDGLGAALETTDPLLRTIEIARNDDSLPTRIVRPNGSVQTRSYDRNGNLLALAETDINATTSFRYEPDFNRLIQATDPLGNISRFEYDEQGNLVNAIDADGSMDVLEYGEPACPGLPTDVTLASGTPSASTSALAYDTDICNVAVVTDPLGRQVTREYDAAGNLVRLVDGEGLIHRWEYDAMNRVEKVIDASNTDAAPQCATEGVTCIDYDAAGNVTQVTDPRGGQISFTYDARNRVVTRTDANGAIAEFEYDAEGNLTCTIDRKGQEITFAYDAANRLIEKTWLPGSPGEEVITLEYDAIDNLTRATDADSVIARTYDAIGRLLSESTQGSPSQPDVTLTYAYDSAGNRTQLAGPGFTNDYDYDENNRLISLTSPAGGAFEFVYDAQGRRIELRRPNDVTTTAVFDAASQLVNLSHQRQGDADPFTDLIYAYDDVGNVVTLDQTRQMLNLQPQLNFSYDDEEQLVQATGPFVGDPDETFQYDPAGNRLLRDGEAFTAIHDQANRLLENQDACFSYDLNGNLIEKQQKIGGACTGAITEYTYNPENQLIQVAVDGNPIADYRYDALGRRIQKETTVGTQKYIYDGVDIVLEYDASDQLQASYLHSLNIDEPLLMRRDQDADGAFETGENFYYQADRLGSILALTDEAGAVAQSYVYKGFGETAVLDASGLEIEPLAGISNPYAFTAREFEPLIGLYYFRARYYYPREGRFLQEDPIGLNAGDSNLYRYVFNSPMNGTDPFGNDNVANFAGNVLDSLVNILQVQEAEKGQQKLADLQTEINDLNASGIGVLVEVTGFETKNVLNAAVPTEPQFTRLNARIAGVGNDPDVLRERNRNRGSISPIIPGRNFVSDTIFFPPFGGPACTSEFPNGLNQTTLFRD